MVKYLKYFFFALFTLSLTSCSSEFISKQNVLNNIYVIQHKSFKGKALVTLDNEDYFSVLQLEITNIVGNDSILLVTDTSLVRPTYHKLLSKMADIYKEDLIEIDVNEYDKIIENIDIKYKFN